MNAGAEFQGVLATLREQGQLVGGKDFKLAVQPLVAATHRGWVAVRDGQPAGLQRIQLYTSEIQRAVAAALAVQPVRVLHVHATTDGLVEAFAHTASVVRCVCPRRNF